MYTITINGNTPEELMANIEKLTQNGAAPIKVPLSEPLPPQLAAQAPAAAQTMETTENPIPAAAVPVAATTPAPSTPTASATPPMTNPIPVEPAPAVPVAAAPTYTLDALARAGATLAQAGKMDQALALLAKYGVQTVNQLKPEQYGAFATELRALGAQV